MNFAATILVIIITASYIAQVAILNYRWRKLIKRMDKRFTLHVARQQQLYEVGTPKSV